MAKGDPRDTLEFSPEGYHNNGLDISSAVTLTPETGATKLLIQALEQNIRYTLDGTTPTSTLGFQIRAGDPEKLIPLGNNTEINVIEEAATADMQYQWGSG